MVRLEPLCAAAPSRLYQVAFTPERLSVALKLTVTLWLVQPAGAVTVVLGGVLSMFTPGLVAFVWLPARSLTIAGAVSPWPLPLIVAGDGQVPSMPEKPSAQVQLIVTGVLYQPAAFGALAGAPVSVGRVVSMLIEPTVVLLWLSALSTATPVTD